MDDPDKLMERTKAAVCYINSTRSGSIQSQAEREMFAFLSLFHPEMSLEQKTKLSQTAEQETEND